jgi:transcriptional regulator
MYVPAHFAMNEAEIKAHLQTCDVANLVTVNAGMITVNLVPVVFDEETGEHGALIGHLAKANPQWTSIDPAVEAMAILAGPDAYVSPSAYESKRQHGRVVPTWNYTAVHAYGSLTWFHDPQRKLEIVTALTNRHERRRAAPWQVADAPPNYIAGLLEAIVGFELTLSRVEGKAKLSQNRSPADQAGVASDLASGPGDKREAVSSTMTSNLRND